MNELNITDAETYKLLYLDVKLKNSILARMNEELKLEKMQLEYEKAKSSKELVILAKKELEKVCNENFKFLITEIADKYQIDMKNYCYDDETGKLVYIEGT